MARKITYKTALRLEKYHYRVKQLRKYVRGLDSKTIDKIVLVQPRTVEAKKERKRILNKVSRLYRKLQPYIERSQKTVHSKDKTKFEALRKYASMPKVKNLRAVPIPSSLPKQTKVSVDKNNNVNVKTGEYAERYYFFPHKPKTPDDVVEMTKAMLPSLPEGFYILVTNVAWLLNPMTDKEALLDGVKNFLYEYRRDSEFLILLRGFKYLNYDQKQADNLRRMELDARFRRKEEKRNAAGIRRIKAKAKSKLYKKLGIKRKRT